ncbi:MAG TPA: glycosyltransferase [Candidatus Bathyarchaeia archaeon]|nr:glycosyltransferase [Candidatus Bathyarchaeia archaeon]
MKPNSCPKKNRYTFIAWQREGEAFRFTRFAAAFGTKTLNFYRTRWLGIRPPLPVRYLLQAWDTVRELRKSRPDVVVVQTPPFPLTLLAWLYARCYGARYVTDNHSGTFTDPKWLRFNFIDRFLFRRAAANIAHNSKNFDTLAGWKANRPLLIPSPAVFQDEILDESAPLPADLEEKLSKSQCKILYVNRFTAWNCYNEAMEAARLMPEAVFFITGDPAVGNLDLSRVPENVVLTGLLPRKIFIKLMSKCDAVLTLTKLKDAVAWTYRDCLALKKPFVGTDNCVARELFAEFGLFTIPDPREIAERLKEVLERREEFIPKMSTYIGQDKERWQRDVQTLDSMLTSG